MASVSSNRVSSIVDGASEVKQAVSLAIQSVPVPASFRCPLALEILIEPVATVDGQVYERSAIQQWFQRGHNTSPLTGLVLPSLALTAEVPLKRAIEEYLRARPELIRQELDLLSLQAIAETLEEEIQVKGRRLVNPQDSNDTLSESLLELTQRGDSQRCLELLAQPGKININEKDRFGRTSLHFCAEKGLSVVAFALLAHADFRQASAVATLEDTTWTAVELAVAKGHGRLASGLNAFIENMRSPAPAQSLPVGQVLRTFREDIQHFVRAHWLLIQLNEDIMEAEKCRHLFEMLEVVDEMFWGDTFCRGIASFSEVPRMRKAVRFTSPMRHDFLQLLERRWQQYDALEASSSSTGQRRRSRSPRGNGQRAS